MSAYSPKEQASRQIWLLYFNRVLLEKGLITKQEYHRMQIKIQSEARSQRRLPVSETM